MACEQDNFSIQCENADEVIEVVAANYGRADRTLCRTRYGPKQWDSFSCYGEGSRRVIQAM